MGGLISITTTATVELNAPTAHVEDPKKREAKKKRRLAMITRLSTLAGLRLALTAAPGRRPASAN
jgi:hypothetical protein